MCVIRGISYREGLFVFRGNDYRRVSTRHPATGSGKLTGRNNDNNQQDDDADNEAHAHLSFHHICLRTRLAPLRKPWADTARLSVLSCSESRRAPRSETLLMLSRMIPTVLSISWSASQRAMSHTSFCALKLRSSHMRKVVQMLPEGAGQPHCYRINLEAGYAISTALADMAAECGAASLCSGSMGG
jgi:hypothetical protein